MNHAVRLRVFVCSWLLTLGLTSFVPAHGQDQPRFRSGVEVTSIDVTVVDDGGRPVADLGPADFTVHVDGAPRRVISAEWVPRAPVAASIRPGSTASAAAYSSNEAPGSGRLVLIVIDQPNIRFGGVIGYRTALSTFIDRLHPSDPIGVINLGTGARSSSFTTDRNAVKRILSTSIGGVPYPPSDKTYGEMTFDAVRALIDAMQEIGSPKTIVLVSQGLVFRDEARPSFAALERAAAAARTTLYALRLDERVSDITRKDPDPRLGPAETGGSAAAERLPDTPFPAGPAGDFGPDGVEAGGELEAVAAATGGAMFTVVTNADRALGRIESELSGSYLLALESTAADRDGMPDRLDVSVGRDGVTVRASRYLPSGVEQTRAAGSPESIAAALASPIPLPGLRLRVATTSSQDADKSKVRLLIRAEVGTGYSSAQAATLGFVITDHEGKIFETRAGNARLQPASAGSLQFNASATVAPGEYTVKLAMAVGDRIGSVEHPVRAILPR